MFRSIQRHITAAVFTVLGLNALANTTPQAWRCQANQMGAWSCSQPNPEPAPTPTTPALAQKTQPSPQTLTPDALSKLLGWIPEKGASCNACAGHYASPPFPRGEKGNEPIDAVPSKVSSDNSSYQMKGQAVLDGHVYVEQPGRRLYADHAEISQAENGKAQRIHAWGNLKVREPQTMVIAHELKADLFTHNAELSNPIYLMELQPRFIGSIVEDTNFTGYAHGQADVVYQRNRNVFDFYHATYTTCPPMKSTWLLHANHIRIDRTQQRGYATNMWLTSHDIPFFYLPYFSFPITKSRQSGFLYGSIGGDFDHGFSLSAPYYFNLAPNYDDTFTPTWYQGRGILWDDQFRFLSQSTIANLDVQYIRDQKTGDASNRGLASYSQTTQLSENWELSALYNYVSDKAYLSDFQNLSGGGLTTAADATELATEANTTVLESSLQLNYSGPHWHWANEFRDYEIVDRTLNLNNRPYNLLPQMNLTGQFPNRFAPFNVDWDAQYTFFQKSEDNGATPINAQRFHIDPAISLPMQRSYGYFTPQVRLAATDYNLLHNQGTSYTENHPSRVLPIATLDTAGYLDRDFAFLHQVYEQTVKPRLFYLYVPFENQSHIPIFDSSPTNFNYSQLFATNRFNGWDRIGDANQLTYDLETTISNLAGRQIINAGVGQIYYFRHPTITVCTAPNCLSNENPYYQQTFSPVAGFFNYSISPAWTLQTNATINPNNESVEYQSYTLQYLFDQEHIFNVGFTVNRHDFALLSYDQILAGNPAPRTSEFTTSALFKLTPLWSAMGNWNYSVNTHRILNEFVAFEYDECCWAIQFGIYRYLLTDNPNNPADLSGNLKTSVLLQFVLKGLGGVGDNGFTSLAGQIPGYTQQVSPL